MTSDLISTSNMTVPDNSTPQLRASNGSSPSSALRTMPEIERDNSSGGDLPVPSAVQRQITRTESHSKVRRRPLKKIHDSGSKRDTSAIALRLMNKGSVARDHLASERTFLAYVRTSLGIASAGVALIQFFRLGDSTKSIAGPIGGAVVVASIIILLLGTRRFFLVQKALVDGIYPTSFLDVILISLVLGCIMTTVLGIVVWGGFQRVSLPNE